MSAFDAVPNESAKSSPPASATTANDTTAPSVPTGVAAVANGTDKIDVSWTASTDNVAVAGYHVFRDGNATAIATVTTGTSYQDPGLAPGSTHSYTVSAFDAVPNESAKSSPPASATTGLAAGHNSAERAVGCGGGCERYGQDRCQLDSIDRQRGGGRLSRVP